tara:strand:- start:870 stop:1292 length:423 start_codon:yes stop_codon:yes gene_type:complete
MTVNLSNPIKILATIDKTAGNARAHTITSYDFIADNIKEIEKSLKNSGIPKTAWVGIVVRIHGGGPVSRSYRYKVTTTELLLKRGARDWFLTDCQKADGYPGQESTAQIVFAPESTKQAAVKHALEQIYLTVRVDTLATL